MKMGLVRRASCLFLAATCVFLTGCHSVVFDGNLHFKSYEPETVPMLYDEVADKMDTINRELDANRFDVAGTDAFFIFPCHESDPEKMLDFKLLDYTDAGTFIYAYMTEFKPGMDRYILPEEYLQWEALGGYPDIGQVQPDGNIGPATIDMLGDRSVPKETEAASAEEAEDETLPPPPTAEASEVTEKVTETTTQPEKATWFAPSDDLAWSSGTSSAPESTTETETYTFDPGEIWWGTDPLNGTSQESSAESSSASGNGGTPTSAEETAESTRSNVDLWWDTGESEGIGHVDWSRVESEAASDQASLEAAIASEEESLAQESRERARREQESREQASREEASRGTADVSEWWEEGSRTDNESESSADETLYFNDPTSEAPSVRVEGGNAAEGYSGADEKTVKVVTVLMAYDPESRVYKVFYARSTAQKAKLTTDQVTGEQKYALASTELTLNANKLVKAERYFLYDNYYGYVFDRDGQEIQKRGYYDSINGFYVLLQNRAREELKASGVSDEEINQRINAGEFTISDVVMDGSYYAYFPITFQLGDSLQTGGADDSEEDDIMDMDEDEADAAVAAEVYQSVMVSMELDIGGNDPEVKFYSENTAWEEQKKEWLSHDGDVVPNGYSEQTIGNYESMDSVKTTKVPDNFPGFHTEGDNLSLTLAYLPNMYAFEGRWRSDYGKSDSYVLYINVLLRELFRNYDLYASNYAEIRQLAETMHDQYRKKHDSASMARMLWNGFPEWTSTIYERSLAALALLAMGDVRMMRPWLREALKDSEIDEISNSDIGLRLRVPWMTPGSWDEYAGSNSSPLPYEVKTPGVEGYSENNDRLEAILACRRVAVNSSDESAAYSLQYIPIIVPGRAEKNTTVQYSMKPVEWTETLTRTVKQERSEYVYETDEAGRKHYVTETNGSGIPVRKTQTITTTYTQTLAPMPLKYQFLFPAGTKLSITMELESSAMVAPTGELGVIFYEDEASDESGREEDETVSTSRINISVAGMEAFHDEGVKGHASDAGILYHKDASGRETELLTLITDEGVQFYKRASSGAEYMKPAKEQEYPWWWKLFRRPLPSGVLEELESGMVYGYNWDDVASERFFINSDEFATRTTNYGLSTISQSEYQNQGSAAIGGVSEEQNRVIQEKMNTGAGMDAFTLDNFALLNEREVVAASINEGLFMVNLRSHLTVSLRSGAFYSAISYRKNGSERFMVVGFDTTEYYYQPMDIVKAKCYDMDLAAQNRERENEAIKGHLTTLANNYLNRTHRIEAGGEGQDGQEAVPYINEAADDAEKAANEQARRLFFGTELSMQQELYKIVTGVGFSYTQRILDYTSELRQKLLTQREKLKEFYALCGLENVPDLLDSATGMPKSADLREQEGTLIHANYTSTLEHALVTLKLSEDAIAGMASDQAEYREYRRQMQEAEAAQDKLQASQPYMYNEEFVKSKDVEKISDRLSDDGLEYLENTDFYRAVLSDVTKAYEDDQYLRYGEVRVSWEDYLKELLNAISPDNAVNQEERGFERFCQLAQIGVSIMTEEQVAELRNRLSEVDHVVDLELLIIEYKLKTAEYQSSPYRNEYESFRDQSFEEETERVKAVQSAGFYEIIRKLSAEAEKEKLLDGTDWKSEMSDIVALCGGGIVLDPDTAELFTEESSE